jgi:aquaporin Z
MRERLPVYLCELAGTAIMIAIGLGAVTFLWSSGSPVPRIPIERLRLLVTGTIFAGGATLVVYSPLGQRSGAHLNPAVTLGFWRLGKISSPDALVYIVMQTGGACAGAALVLALAGDLAREVRLGMTTPGSGVGPMAAVGWEAAITFALVFLILTCLSRPNLAPRTGVIAGSLVALLVMLEAPLTGTSLNPARSLAPALLVGDLSQFWIYAIGPPLGALAAAQMWMGRWGTRQALICAKIYHGNRPDRIFAGCPYVTFGAGDVLVREGEPGDAAFVIEAGRATVRRGETVLATLGPGDWFGEMSVLLGEPRTATVVAATHGRMRRLTRDVFEQALKDDPAHAIAMLRQLAGRLRDTTRRT